MRRILVALSVGLLTVGASAQWITDADMPAYHPAPPVVGEKLPPVLSGTQLEQPIFQYPWQRQAYLRAAKVQSVIYQLPCYCHCDRSMGHKSLHSCFEGLHGAECTTCAREGLYAYQMTVKGKSVKEIRDGVNRGDFQSIDLNSPGL